MSFRKNFARIMTMILLGLSVPSWAATYYVRSGAAGDGSDWTNAYHALPPALERGSTYYIAAGTYPPHFFNDAESSATLIIVRKATDADHGITTGWQAEYAGQAVFSQGFSIQAGYYAIEGAARNENDWQDIDAYGFRINADAQTSGVTASITIPNTVGHVTLSHIAMTGPALSYGMVTGRGISTEQGADNLTVSGCLIRNTADPIVTRNVNTMLVEKSWFGPNYPMATDLHCEGWNDAGSHNVTIRNNKFVDIMDNACIRLNSETGTDHRNWVIHGNLFMHEQANIWNGWGVGEGIIIVTGNNTASGWRVFNNSIVGIRGWFASIVLPGTDNQVYNNIWSQLGMNPLGNPTGMDIQASQFGYNWYFPNNGASVVLGEGDVMGASDPFMDYETFDIRLTPDTLGASPIDAGKAMDGYDNLDMAGNVRGANGAWDIGALEYNPGPTPTPVPTLFNIGVESILGKSDAGNSTFVLASKAELTQAAEIRSLSAYVKVASGQMRLAIYDDNSGKPGALVAQTNSFATVAGWNTADVTQSATLQPGYYWLAFESDNDTVAIAGTSSDGTYVYRSGWTYQAYPATFPATSGSGSWSFSIYATLASTASATPTPTPTATPIATATPVATNITLGIDTILSKADAGNSSFVLASKAQLAQSATIQSISAYIKTAGGHMRFAMYADNAGKPGALIAQTGSITTVAGWNTAAVTQAIAVQPGSYWLAFEADNDTVSVAGTSSGGSYVYHSGWTYQAYPSVFPATSGSGSWSFSIYATLTSTSSVITPTPTPTPTTLTMGLKTILGSADANNATYMLASKAQLTKTATLKSISAYIKKAGGGMRMAVYKDNSGKPGALMATTNAFTTKAGWNTVAVTNTGVILQPGYYWLAFETDNNTVSIAGGSSGGSYVYRSNWTYQAFPSTFPAISGSGAWSFSIYATLLTTTATVTPTPTPAVTPSPTPTAGKSVVLPLYEGVTTGPMVIVEALEDAPQNQQAHRHMGYSTEPRPAEGESITIPGSRFPLTMMACYEADPNINYGGTGMERGYFPGYSRYPCVSPDGKYAIAYSTQGGISTIWDTTTFKRIRYPQVKIGSKYYDLGEYHQLRWDYSQPTRHILVAVIKNVGLVYENVDDPLDQGLLPGTPTDVDSDDHQGSSERFISFQTATYKGLYDLQKRAVSPMKWPVGVDLNIPDVYKNWARIERCPVGSNSVSYFFNLDDNDVTTDSVLTLTGTHGHEAWGLDSKGNPVWFYQDNKLDGYLYYSPVEKKTSWVIGCNQLGYPNYHPTSMWSANTKGWMLFSTYDPDDYTTQWTANQWLMVQMDDPHCIGRIGHNETLSFMPDNSSKTYFAEAHTSISPDGRYVWTGTNLHRTEPSTQPLLALMRLDLGTNYFDRLNQAAAQLNASP